MSEYVPNAYLAHPKPFDENHVKMMPKIAGNVPITMYIIKPVLVFLSYSEKNRVKTTQIYDTHNKQ